LAWTRGSVDSKTGSARIAIAPRAGGRESLSRRSTASIDTDGIVTIPAIDLENPFFQDIGANGRTCFSCHRPAQAWTITPEEIRQRFDETAGRDPVFRNNDGSNCEGADVSTLPRRRRAYSLLLTKGLIRVGLAVPANAEFEIVEIDDPYDCGAALTQASMYRRPLPTTNLGFLSTVMWDGRETVKGQAIRSDLLTQASDATTGHAQGIAPSPAQLEQIVDFELRPFRRKHTTTARAASPRMARLAGRGRCRPNRSASASTIR
jgi:hypothetical protein